MSIDSLIEIMKSQQMTSEKQDIILEKTCIPDINIKILETK